MEKLNGHEFKALMTSAHSAGERGIPFELYFEILKLKAVKLDPDDPKVRADLERTIKEQEKILKLKSPININDLLKPMDL